MQRGVRMNIPQYIPLVYSRKVSAKRAQIYLMQYEFIPAELYHLDINSYSTDEAGETALKAMVEANNSYYEKYDKGIIVDKYPVKPTPKADWNYYALQRLIHNELLDHNYIVIVYSTQFKDLITIRF